MTQGIKTCVWIKTPASIGKPAKYCRAKCSYKMVKDQDENPERVYNTFCFIHQKISEEQAKVEDDINFD